jgi:hypothetical protein
VFVEFSFMPSPARGSEDAYETERIPPIVGRIALRADSRRRIPLPPGLAIALLFASSTSALARNHRRRSVRSTR